MKNDFNKVFLELSEKDQKAILNLIQFKNLNKKMELQKKVDKAIEDIKFCLISIKEERYMSKDERTRKEMKTCMQILEETLKMLEGD